MAKRIVLSLFGLIIFLTTCPYVWGQSVKIETARIIKTKGTVMVYQHQHKKWSVAKIGMKVLQRDILKTLSDSEADLLIEDIAVVRLKENTILDLSEIKRETTKPVASSSISLVEKRPSGAKKKNILKLLKGRLLLWVGHIFQGSTFEVLTPIGVAGVRGTRFMVSVPDKDTTIVATLEGIIEAKNIEMPDKTVLVREMEISIIHRGAYPTEPRKVSEQEYSELKEALELKLLKKEEEFEGKPGSSSLESMGGYETMMPGGTMPGGTMPGGTMPGGTMPGGGMGSGTMPGGTGGGGSMPGGSMPGGGMGSGTMPGGTGGGGSGMGGR